MGAQLEHSDWVAVGLSKIEKTDICFEKFETKMARCVKNRGKSQLKKYFSFKRNLFVFIWLEINAEGTL